MATGGGTLAAMFAINDSGIIPGPLGMAETTPMADAPWEIASLASSTDLIQQIFTLVRTETLSLRSLGTIFHLMGR